MEINLHNYEAFFLDHKEGNLSAELQNELFLFLEKHPHLYEELAAFENVTLDDLGVAEIFPAKESIRRTEFTNDDLIAYTEGIADAKTKREIEKLSSQSRELKKELALYEAAVVQPDLSVRFENRSTLKKRGIVIALQSNYTFLRVAAAVLLLIGSFFLIYNLTSSDIKEAKVVAENDIESGNSKQQKETNSEHFNENKQLAEKRGEQKSNYYKQEKVNGKLQIKKKESGETREYLAGENKDVVVNAGQTNTVSTNTNKTEEPVFSNNTAVKNEQIESPATIKSYYNYRPDTDNDETPVVTASAAPAKKSFFNKLANVAKSVNKFGLKKVNASEQSNSNTISIGSLVLTETTSN
ncbi:MAG: hypothetical protein ACXVPN_13970 [Bacteroidia bacterium]